MVKAYLNAAKETMTDRDTATLLVVFGLILLIVELTVGTTFLVALAAMTMTILALPLALLIDKKLESRND